MNEQQEKTYYDGTLTIIDRVLYPAQKLSMMFELLNTPENILLQDKI